MPRIEIVHYRDSDSACDMRIFIDGVESYDTVTTYEFDPGAGHQCSDLTFGMEEELAAASDAVRPLVQSFYESALRDKYTEHDYEYTDIDKRKPGESWRRCRDCGRES